MLLLPSQACSASLGPLSTLLPPKQQVPVSRALGQEPNFHDLTLSFPGPVRWGESPASAASPALPTLWCDLQQVALSSGPQVVPQVRVEKACRQSLGLGGESGEAQPASRTSPSSTCVGGTYGLLPSASTNPFLMTGVPARAFLQNAPESALLQSTCCV